MIFTRYGITTNKNPIWPKSIGRGQGGAGLGGSSDADQALAIANDFVSRVEAAAGTVSIGAHLALIRLLSHPYPNGQGETGTVLEFWDSVSLLWVALTDSIAGAQGSIKGVDRPLNGAVYDIQTGRDGTTYEVTFTQPLSGPQQTILDAALLDLEVDRATGFNLSNYHNLAAGRYRRMGAVVGPGVLPLWVLEADQQFIQDLINAGILSIIQIGVELPLTGPYSVAFEPLFFPSGSSLSISTGIDSADYTPYNALDTGGTETVMVDGVPLVPQATAIHTPDIVRHYSNHGLSGSELIAYQTAIAELQRRRWQAWILAIKEDSEFSPAAIDAAMVQDGLVDQGYRAQPIIVPIPWLISIRVGAGEFMARAVLSDASTPQWWIEGSIYDGTETPVITATQDSDVFLLAPSLLANAVELELYGTATDARMVSRLVNLTKLVTDPVIPGGG